MCTYSQLNKKIQKHFESRGKDISKCIERGSMKLATRVDYVYM